ncbi:transcriptional regulatory [Fusarium albosuccineum]|uniref:Transcriptional regulatory n=1 Tax=Fusarium albosuccineum TaxID=1237068 RepID=A0A8H4LA60_9HYPO|nr:transcriptional regulatory [Fusarium albosuccineum]
MARKGSKKVRTGCITCKVRKIKCDETRPCCRRCTNTGRDCDGYLPQSQPMVHLAVIPQRLGTPTERRALQYFCEVAAPRLLGPKSPYFWTHLVIQLSETEPVVKHSLLAISSLYETREVQKTPSYMPNLALQHYNAAIQGLKATQSDVLALLGCILFICIELLQSNNETAIRHCAHGIAIMERCGNPWAREHLEPIFRRIGVLPQLFGNNSTELSRSMVLGFVVPSKFDSLEDAQIMTDDIFNRLMRLCSMKKQGLHFDRDLEREYLKSLLDRWQFLIKGLEDHAAAQTDGACSEQHTSTMMRFQLCQACFNLLFCSAADDDDNEKAFRGMVESAACLSELHTIRSTQFLFELGSAHVALCSDET